MTKTVLITGSSSGFGKNVALLFKEKGWNVAASMRSPEGAAAWAEQAGLFTPRLDVTVAESIQAAVDETIARFGRIDVLVNNAGFGLMGPLEGAQHDDVRRQLDTNVLGVIAMIQAVLPSMRSAGGGVIVNVSSLGGRLSFPLYAAYNASKFALEGLTEALQYELQEHNVQVKLVEPGAAITNFATTSAVHTPHPAYSGLMDAALEMLAKVQESAPGPEKVTLAIYKAATDGSSRLRYPVLAFPFLPVRRLLGARLWSALMKFMARRLSASKRRQPVVA